MHHGLPRCCCCGVCVCNLLIAVPLTVQQRQVQGVPPAAVGGAGCCRAECSSAPKVLRYVFPTPGSMPGVGFAKQLSGRACGHCVQRRNVLCIRVLSMVYRAMQVWWMIYVDVADAGAGSRPWWRVCQGRQVGSMHCSLHRHAYVSAQSHICMLVQTMIPACKPVLHVVVLLTVCGGLAVSLQLPTCHSA